VSKLLARELKVLRNIKLFWVIKKAISQGGWKRRKANNVRGQGKKREVGFSK